MPAEKATSLRATNDGRVLHLRDGKERPQYKNAKGYLYVTSWIDGKTHTFLVHHLVARDFLPQRPSPKHQLRHLDGNKANNSFTNLAWGTAAENAADRIAHGTQVCGGQIWTAKYTAGQINSVREKYTARKHGDAVKAAQELGTTRAYAARILRGECWRHLAQGQSS